MAALLLAVSAAPLQQQPGFRAGDLAGILADEKMIDNRITSVRGEFLASLAKVRAPGEAAARAADAAEAEVTGGDGDAGGPSAGRSWQRTLAKSNVPPATRQR